MLGAGERAGCTPPGCRVSAVDPQWVADPRTAARAIGAGLRLLHDALPVADCPFGPPPWVTAGTAAMPSTGWWSATATRAHPTR